MQAKRTFDGLRAAFLLCMIPFLVVACLPLAPATTGYAVDVHYKTIERTRKLGISCYYFMFWRARNRSYE